MRSALALVAAAVLTGIAAGPSQAPPPARLAGTWNLNTWLTDPGDQIAAEVRADFGPSTASDIFGTPADTGGMREGMGRRGAPPRTETPRSSGKPQLEPEEQKRIQSLIDLARLPADTLTITETADTVTIADPVRGSRTVHTNGVKEKQTFPSGTIESATRWEGPQLVIDYDAGHGKSLRFSYMLAPPANELLVRTSLMMPGNQAAPFTVRHVYDKVNP